jgi:alginate O-acetyltransferase complex protein AlgJ
MSVESIHDARVAKAHAEVGQTEVSRPVALTLVTVFVATIAAVPITQIWVAPGVLGISPDAIATASTDMDTASPIAHVVTRNRQVLIAVQRLSDRLDTDSLLARHLRPAVQQLLTQRLGIGNERVYPGRDAWLYYAPDVRHVIGPGFLDERQLARRAASGDSVSVSPAPDPRPALRAFNEALARRGITLVLLPTPVKPSIHPEHLGAGASGAPLRNVSFSQFAEEMQAAGVLLFDPAPLLAELGADGDAAYLARDTHWRPDAVVAVARALARFLERETSLPVREPVSLDVRQARVSDPGDIVGLLDLSIGPSPYPSETVEVQRIVTSDGRPWTPTPTADVLLLGDSFSNVFSLESLGWGTAAGLAEQLSLALRRPVDRLVQNDDGAFATREALAREQARGRDRLAGKQVVIYQFATRELTHGDWRLVDLDSRRPAADVAASFRILTPQPGQILTVRGRVRQRTSAPRPGTVPYRDHIIAVDLADIDGATVNDGEALVYLSSMEDNVWTAAASLVVDQTITLTLRPWAEVAPERDGITRSELTAGDVVFAEPWWGELIQP